MLKRLLLATALAMVVTSPAIAKDVVVRYNNWLPPNYFMSKKALDPYFEEIKKVTEGRVVIEQTANAVGPVPRNYQLVTDGVADMSWGIHGYTPGAFPLSEMVELPFITKSAEENSVAYWKVFKKYFEPSGMHADVHTLTVQVHAPGNIFTTKPVTKVEDFVGLRLRAPSAGTGKRFEKLGAAPVGAPVTETREMISRGLIDGLGFTSEAIYAFKLDSYIKNVIRFPGGFYNVSFFVVINKDKWGSIAPADQAAIDAISGEALARKMGRVWDEEVQIFNGRLVEDKKSVEEASPELVRAIKEKIGDEEAAWVEQAGKAGVDGQAALSEFKQLIGQ